MKNKKSYKKPLSYYWRKKYSEELITIYYIIDRNERNEKFNDFYQKIIHEYGISQYHIIRRMAIDKLIKKDKEKFYELLEK